MSKYIKYDGFIAQISLSAANEFNPSGTYKLPTKIHLNSFLKIEWSGPVVAVWKIKEKHRKVVRDFKFEDCKFIYHGTEKRIPVNPA